MSFEVLSFKAKLSLGVKPNRSDHVVQGAFQREHHEQDFVRQPLCKDHWLQALQLQRGNWGFVDRSVMTQDDPMIMGRLSVTGPGQPSQVCPQISVGRCLTELQLISRRAFIIEAQPTPLVLLCSHST